MNTIKVMGGLGNQMFQFALYKEMEQMGKDVALDLTWYKTNSNPDMNFGLSVFDVKYNLSSIKRKYIIDNANLFHRIIRNLRFSYNIYFEKQNGIYDERVLTVNNRFIEGYWQSEKYFIQHKDIIKAAYQYKGKWSEKNTAYRSAIHDTNSVSIHVRLGDYVNQKSSYGGICTSNYYASSIQYLKENLENPHFYIFTNDVETCKKIFEDEKKVTFVEGNFGTTSFFDMLLMSECKHHIIANSSFSWWGAYLSSYKGITIAPSVWMNDTEMHDVYCENWIRISPKGYICN